jgi:REP element-mobilizing transposase RayT
MKVIDSRKCSPNRGTSGRSRDCGKRLKYSPIPPMNYFITFSCYGCHLHGHGSGSVDSNHRQFGSRLLEPDSQRVARERERMDQAPYDLDDNRRQIVLWALQERCRERGWDLLAAHVRSTHIHLIVAAEVRPERIMNDLKCFLSRCLNRTKLDRPGCKRWARHGSTRWLWKQEDLRAAIRYVVDQQGPPMAVFEPIEPGHV